MTISDSEIAALRKALAESTPGTWFRDDDAVQAVPELERDPLEKSAAHFDGLDLVIRAPRRADRRVLRHLALVPYVRSRARRRPETVAVTSLAEGSHLSSCTEARRGLARRVGHISRRASHVLAASRAASCRHVRAHAAIHHPELDLAPGDGRHILVGCQTVGSVNLNAADARFIVLAHTLLPQLLDELEILRVELQRQGIEIKRLQRRTDALAAAIAAFREASGG